MNIDARTLDDGSAFEADLCIIGAGAAGITMAKELKGLPIKILLLESGGYGFDADTTSLYEGENTGLRYFPLTACRLRFFGGTTGHWAGWCSRLDPIDFEKRDWIPHSGWPIGFKDLEPWYQKAQKICELGPYNYDPAYWQKETGTKAWPLSPDKVRVRISQFSAPTRFGTVYRDEIINAPNISLWTYANVTDIRSNPAASHIDGLEVRTLNDKTLTVKARHYVLACGGMENARILLLSNKVVKPGLGNQSDQVGRYFMEHPHINTSSLILSPGTDMSFYLWRNLEMTNSDYFRQRTPYIPLFSVPPAIQKTNRTANYTSILCKDDEAESRQSKGAASNPAWILNCRTEQIPNPESRITLSAEKRDRLGQPQIRFHWQLTDQDKRTIRLSERLIANELGRTGIGRLNIPDWLVAEDNVWPEKLLFGGNHHIGTTRMSSSPATGVVDANCRVHGLDNLYIAGSSVFPTSGTANPTMTIVAMAARLADHLKQRSRE